MPRLLITHSPPLPNEISRRIYQLSINARDQGRGLIRFSRDVGIFFFCNNFTAYIRNLIDPVRDNHSKRYAR